MPSSILIPVQTKSLLENLVNRPEILIEQLLVQCSRWFGVFSVAASPTGTFRKQHSQANLRPSEVVTLAILFALKGVGNRAFYRWLGRDYRPLIPNLPVRTRLFRLFNTHRPWTQLSMADYSLIGLIDTYSIELIHPRREGRSEGQLSKKGCAIIYALRLLTNQSV